MQNLFNITGNIGGARGDCHTTTAALLGNFFALSQAVKLPGQG